MRWNSSIAAALIFAIAAGCDSTDPDLKPRGPVSESHGPLNTAMVKAYSLKQADNAVIRQHTLYPYHFQPHSAELNTLGEREVHVLAMHYKNYPGPLNVHQGEESDAVYQARVKTVMDSMVDAGVSANRIAISDGMPGGEGITANMVVLILKRIKEGQLKAADSDSGFTTDTDDSGQGSTSGGAGTGTQSGGSL